MTYGISMFCGCLAIVISELNHQVECLKFVADIGTFIFCLNNLVVVVNKELCSEAITLIDRCKENILKNFMLSFVSGTIFPLHCTKQCTFLATGSITMILQGDGIGSTELVVTPLLPCLSVTL
jgi:hypothetical protein